MNIRILAERRAQALKRIEAVAPEIISKLGLDPELEKRLTATSKEREIEAMLRVEAVADMLEAIDAALQSEPEPEPEPAVEAVAEKPVQKKNAGKTKVG